MNNRNDSFWSISQIRDEKLQIHKTFLKNLLQSKINLLETQQINILYQLTE